MPTAFSDRLNPILVKEVRAALRGRVFRILFPLVAVVAVFVAMINLMDLNPARDANVGRDFLEPIYVMLCIALLGIVPLTAFFSMGSEWEENTFDLLSISDLRPRHIVFGKLLSAGIEATLYFSAFVPLLVMAFLLRGIDIGALSFCLLFTYLASFAASALALALSSLSRIRIVRVLLLCMVAAGGIGLVAAAYEITQSLVMRGASSVSSRAWDQAIITFGFMAAALFLGTTVACERLSHPEENHSTGPRVLVTTIYASLLGFCTYMWFSLGGTARNIVEPLIMVLFIASLAHVFFVTEREDMTHRVRRSVPANRFLAILATPFLPGGGRALLLFGLHVLMASAVLTVGLVRARTRSSGDLPDVVLFELLTAFAAYLFIYLGVVSWVARKYSARTGARWIARVAIPVTFVLGILLPAFFSFVVGGRPDFDHALNPFVMFYNWSKAAGGAGDKVIVAAILVGLLNLPRVVSGVLEVLRASAENRTRSKATE
ncbi:MAG: hypothetical protein JNL28_11185 [Planctomycetes bacterium]|nr:hypothetical protein [Planctomycetota bacterium]